MRFAAVETDGCPTVGLLASKACTTFSHWGLNAGQIDLFLVAKGGPEDPSDDAIASVLTCPRLGVGKSLAASGILSGAWLVARNYEQCLGFPLAASGSGDGIRGVRGAPGFDIAAAFGSLQVWQDEFMARLSDDDAVSSTPADYKESAQLFLRETVLPHWLGLLVVPEVLIDGLEGDLSGNCFPNLQWDFRAPVTVSSLPPSQSGKTSNFVVYPSWDSYTRPEKPTSSFRLTPTKAAHAREPPVADFMAIFEVTIANKWADFKDGQSLLTRLEERLFISLARANALRNADTPELTILDVVAVVGVVGVFHCQRKIASVRADSRTNDNVRPASSSLLWKLMDAGRFVFVRQPYGDSTIRSP